MERLKSKDLVTCEEYNLFWMCLQKIEPKKSRIMRTVLYQSGAPQRSGYTPQNPIKCTFPNFSQIN